MGFEGSFKGFKGGLMWMFWTFKLRFDVDNLAIFGYFSKKLSKFSPIF
jgi:hypothetical protein